MNRDNLYEFVTGLLDGFQMDSTLFDTFLDVAQSNREGARPWVYLRREDSSQIANTSDTYTTEKFLPEGFKKTYTRFPIVLTDSQGNVVRKLREIPIHERHQYRNDGNKFYINYAEGTFFLCGTQSQTCTINFYYIESSSRLSEYPTSAWVLSSFDGGYTKILGFDVAVMHKLGVDYDQINAAQADNNALQAKIMFEQMAEWDSQLAQSAQEGVDFGSVGNTGFQELGGSAMQLM